MSGPAAPPTPLEEHDPERARALKAKIRDRVADVRRHLIALRTAMAELGDDFDLDAFRAAYDSEDPVARRMGCREPRPAATVTGGRRPKSLSANPHKQHRQIRRLHPG